MNENKNKISYIDSNDINSVVQKPVLPEFPIQDIFSHSASDNTTVEFIGGAQDFEKPEIPDYSPKPTPSKAGKFKQFFGPNFYKKSEIPDKLSMKFHKFYNYFALPLMALWFIFTIAVNINEMIVYEDIYTICFITDFPSILWSIVSNSVMLIISLILISFLERKKTTALSLNHYFNLLVCFNGLTSLLNGFMEYWISAQILQINYYAGYDSYSSWDIIMLGNWRTYLELLSFLAIFLFFVWTRANYLYYSKRSGLFIN